MRVGRWIAAQSSPARIPASGPGVMLHPIGNDRQAERRKAQGIAVGADSRHSHCGSSRAMTRAKIVWPPISRSGLSPPPIRRARPPASTTPGMPKASVIAVVFVRGGPRPRLPGTPRLGDRTLHPLARLHTCPAMTVTKLDLSGLKCPLPALKNTQSLEIHGAGRSAGSALHRPAFGDRHPPSGRGDRRPVGRSSSAASARRCSASKSLLRRARPSRRLAEHADLQPAGGYSTWRTSASLIKEWRIRCN